MFQQSHQELARARHADLIREAAQARLVSSVQEDRSSDRRRRSPQFLHLVWRKSARPATHAA